MHTKTQVTVIVNGKERIRTRITCEETGWWFTIHKAGFSTGYTVTVWPFYGDY